MTTAISPERAWYVIDIATGARLDDADDAVQGHPLTLPTGREVVLTGQDRPTRLTWADPDPESGTTGSGGAFDLRGWIDSSTTITLSHHVELRAGTSMTAVSTWQQLLKINADTHARAWVERLARYGAATTGTD